MTDHPTRGVRLTKEQRTLMESALLRDVMVLQAADTFQRLNKRGLVRMELRDLGLREPVWCIALTDEGLAAISQGRSR